MSIFGTIMSKVFGGAAPTSAAPSAAQTAGTGSPPSPPAPPTVSSQPGPDTHGSMSTSTATPAAGGHTVDVAAVLDGMVEKSGEKSNWRVSIVDLMKLLGMDYSLSSRKELAHELNYTGDTNDSATMNIWLHKQVMAKFAANGGKLPSDLQGH